MAGGGRRPGRGFLLRPNRPIFRAGLHAPTPVNLIAAGGQTYGGSATLSIEVHIPVPSGADPGYMPNGEVYGGLALLTIDPAILPEPTGSHVLVLPTLAYAYTAPTIIDGQPYADVDRNPWLPSSETHDLWGKLRVIVAGHDVTWFRGFQTIVGDWSDADPGGDDTATIIFPGITSFDQLGTGALSWLDADAEVRIQKRDPITGDVLGTIFEGEIGPETDTVATNSGTAPASVATFHCRGLWNVLDDFITLPRSKPDPIESAEWIEDLVQHARHFGFPGHVVPSNVTGILTGERGEYGASLKSQTITNALKLMQRDDGTVYSFYRVGPRRFQIQERVWDVVTPDFSVQCGGRGISHSLTRDPTIAYTAIFGRGQYGNQAWENWQYPVAYVNPPAYPLDILAGQFFTAGSSYTGFQPFSDELRDHFDYSIDSQDTYLSSDLQTIEDFQDSIGIQVDGVVGPQTWNAAFQIGQNANVLDGAYIRELWSVGATQPDLLNARGGVLGPNPDFDPAAWRRREKLVDYGVLAKPTARKSARREGGRIKLPYYIGTVTAESVDPPEMHALDTHSGMNMHFEGHRGANRLLHVVRCDRNPGMQPGQPRSVTWTVSEKPDDLMTLAQLIARRQGVHDVVSSIRPQRRSSHKTPDWVPFDSESGAGILHSTAQTAGLWNVYQIPMGEAVDVAAVKIIADVSCTIAAAMFNMKVTPEMLVALPGLADPSGGAAGDDPWQANTNALQALGIQWSTGGPGAMQGYWPNTPAIGATITGVLADTSAWPYRTIRPPWGWLLVWTSANCHVAGDPSLDPHGRPRAIFPAPEQ